MLPVHFNKRLYRRPVFAGHRRSERHCPVTLHCCGHLFGARTRKTDSDTQCHQQYSPNCRACGRRRSGSRLGMAGNIRSPAGIGGLPNCHVCRPKRKPRKSQPFQGKSRGFTKRICHGVKGKRGRCILLCLWRHCLPISRQYHSLCRKFLAFPN